MEDLFKKFIYTGIGLVSITKDRLQKNIDALVADQKLSREEGRKIVDDVMEKSETTRGEFEAQMKKVSEELTERFNFAKAKEVEELRKRVESLELKLSRLKATETKPASNPAASETAVNKNENLAPGKKSTKNTSSEE